MPQTVATGQFTIVDNNDARPITGIVYANPGPQQSFSKDESSVSYIPDWEAANGNAGLQLTAKVYLGAPGSAVDITGQLTNRQWSTAVGGAAIVGTGALVSANAPLNAIFNAGAGKIFTALHNAAGSTLTVKSNIMETVPTATLYFEADWTDPATGLTAHVMLPVTLGMVKQGTNAVFINTRGNAAIEQATGATKNIVAIAADVIRAAGIDTTGMTYRFFDALSGLQIVNTAAYNTKFGMKTSAAPALPTGAQAEIGVGLPAAGAWSAFNTLVIHETGVVDQAIFRVEAKDADGTVYQTYFTVFDVSDPYDVRVLSSTGDKLQNGMGSTSLTPEVFYGATRISDLTGWAFNWTFFNRDGKRGAFIDTTRTAVAGGRAITVNTTGAASVFTYSGAAIAFAAGDIIKAVKPDGSERFYEVASGSGNTVTIRAAVTNNGWLSAVDYPVPAVANEFVNGVLFVCVGNQGKKSTAAAAALVLTGDEVDIKARLMVEAIRP